jgi:hypothetical protein
MKRLVFTNTDLNEYTNYFGGYAILALSFGLAPSGGIHMQVVKRRPPETQYAT